MLLINEPFARLDPQTRNRLHAELNEIVLRTHTTLVFVTRSLQLALILGDRVDAGTDALILVAVCAVVLPIATNLRAGLRSVDPTLLLAGQNLGLRGWSMVSEVLLPAALPHAIYRLRGRWACGWRTVIAAWLVFGVGGEGPGFSTNDSGDFLPVPDLFAGLLSVALAGILTEAAFGLLERRTVAAGG